MPGLKHSDLRKKIVEIFDKAEESLQLDTYKHRLIVDRIDIGNRHVLYLPDKNAETGTGGTSWYGWNARIYFHVNGDRKPDSRPKRFRDFFKRGYPSFKVQAVYERGVWDGTYHRIDPGTKEEDRFDITVPDFEFPREAVRLSPGWILRYMLICGLDRERKANSVENKGYVERSCCS